MNMNGLPPMSYNNLIPPPPMGTTSTQPGQRNYGPKLKDMQAMLFTKPKSPRSAVIEGIL